MKSRGGGGPAASAVPICGGKVKLRSRPPPAAALARRKVRRDRVRTVREINSPRGFVQQANPDPGRRYGRMLNAMVSPSVTPDAVATRV
jgi:hypothetical protein